MRRLREFLSLFDRKDIPTATHLVALLLIGFGGERLVSGLGFFLVGILVMLELKPLSRWVK